MKNIQCEAIAVVGVSALYPEAGHSQQFWRNILDSKDSMQDVPADHWLIEDYYDPDPSLAGKIYAKRGGFIPDIDFDPMQFGLPPTVLKSTDTVQLLALIVAQKVLNDALSVQFHKVDKKRVSVILGIASATELVGQMAGKIQKPQWIKALREAGIAENQVQAICAKIMDGYVDWNENVFPGLLGNVVAGRIANRLDLGGTNCVIDAACASSLGAVTMAMQELQLGHSDLVITGGADALNDPFMYMCFSKTPALSATGDCRPFSDAADGTMLGEGIGMVALRRLSDAERDGDKIYAVIRGLGSSSDGKAKSVYAPHPEGQALAIKRAYERAGYSMDEVELIEAHGTGTKAGDVAEFGGLKLAFSEAKRQDKQWCALGSVKSQIGHTKAAAGAASLFKVVMALQHKVLPPTIKVNLPNQKLDIQNSPFYLNTQKRPWIHAEQTTRKAGVSAFGFGGSNFHLTLEEYPNPNHSPLRIHHSPIELILVDASNQDELMHKLNTLPEQLAKLSLANLARQNQLSYQADAKLKLALLAVDANDLLSLAKQASVRIQQTPGANFSIPNKLYYNTTLQTGKVAFLFAGQGSQYLNMGSALAVEFDEARKIWDAAASLNWDEAYPLHQVVFPIPVFSAPELQQQTELLKQTQWAQPAIGAVALSQLALLDKLGVKPDCTAGHSYGEFPALYAAGVIATLPELLEISRKRGEFMAQAASSSSGAMTAVMAELTAVEQILAAISDVTIANINSPQQIVIAGTVSAIEQAELALTAQSINFQRLPVATGFHSALVRDAVTPFAEFLAKLTFKAPTIPVYSNATSQPYPTSHAEILHQMSSQLSQPVLFQQQIENMYADGVRTFIELGPNTILSRLVSDCLPGQPHAAIAFDHKKQDGLLSFWNALAQLSVAGIKLNYKQLWADFMLDENPINKTLLSPAAVKINGSNYGKPYPLPGGAKDNPKPNLEPVVIPATITTAVATQTAPIAKQILADEGISMSKSTSSLTQEYLNTLEALQKNSAQAQEAFQKTLMESHLAFVQATEEAFKQIGQIMGADYPVARQDQPAPQFHTEAKVAQTLIPPQTITKPSPVESAVSKTFEPLLPQPANDRLAVPTTDFKALLFAVVAEKTGYPQEMLELDMELEAGLGIDSIKRVEILSALQQKIPQLAEQDPTKLSTLNTLREILSVAEFGLENNAAKPIVQSINQASPQQDYQQLILSVVAEKTGYPQEMLSLDMELEAGLGIDSIKRVEILSTLQQQIPELAKQDPTKLSSLNTLGEILAFTQNLDNKDTTVVSQAIANVDTIKSTLLDIVAEKTGYPKEMLSLDMELEAGLGIDSIKRVEILSTLQQHFPVLAQQDSSKLTSLNTLSEILSAIDSKGEAPKQAKRAEPVSRAADEETLQRYTVTAVATPASGIAMAGLKDANPVYLIADEQGVAPILASMLETYDIKAEVVAALPRHAQAVIFLPGINPIKTIEQAIALNEQAFIAATQCAKQLFEKDGFFITVQDTQGNFGLSGQLQERAWLGGIAALTKTAGQEWPTCAVKALDINCHQQSAKTIAEIVLQELLFGGPELEVGYNQRGERFSLKVATLPNAFISEAAKPLAAESVLVVTGGARGVTAACLKALAEQKQLKIAILGRSQLVNEPEELQQLQTDAELKHALLAYNKKQGLSLTPVELNKAVQEILANREVEMTLNVLTAFGSKVKYFSIDVADAQAVANVISQVREEWGPIHGIIHAAGVLADKYIHEKTIEQFTQVFQTKVLGFKNLLAATSHDPLTHICCFSSVAARTGNKGQVDYAMANEILNKACQEEFSRRNGSCIVKSINWGPWDGGMVKEGLKAHFTAMGVSVIPLNAGAELFVQELQHFGPIEVVIGGSLEQWQQKAGNEQQQWNILIDKDKHAFIFDHQIHGIPVLPAVAFTSWCLALSQQLYPNYQTTAQDMKILKGIQLPHLASTQEWLVLSCLSNKNAGAIQLVYTLASAKGVKHYELIIAVNTKPQTLPQHIPLRDLAPWPWSKNEIYDGSKLFHGPAFQVIDKLVGVSEKGGKALLDMANTHQNIAELAILDAGLQLAIIWKLQASGHNALPTSFEQLILAPTWNPSQIVACECVVQEQSSLYAHCDIYYLDATHKVQAAIKGLMVHTTNKLFSESTVQNLTMEVM